MKLPHFLRSGKNVKLFYFATEMWRDLMPHMFFRKFESYLREAQSRPDFDYIMERVHYYCRRPGAPLGDGTVRVCDLRRRDCSSTYYFDVKHALTPFAADTRINFLPGDITYVPEVPSLTKSRPIEGDNANSVILKMDRIRHFITAHDKVPFEAKADKAVFRGKVPGKEKRERFFGMHFDNPICDSGDSDRHGRPEWRRPRMTIGEQLAYKFILSLEGNDVASNLKWVMGSGSAAVMPVPEYETWFMEGRLVPGVHYIEIARDFSDFTDVINYYIQHPAETRAIIAAANEYCTQFADKRRERLIEVLTAGAYLGLLK